MALKVKMNSTDLDELETEIPLFATQEESEDIQVDEQMTIKIKVKEKANDCFWFQYLPLIDFFDKKELG